MPADAGPLLAQLRQEAEAAISERGAQARAEAARIRDTAAAQRARRRTAMLDEQERALARQREAARARAAQSTVREVLTARATFVTRVFDEAERRLEALAGTPDLAARLTPLFAEALPFLADDDARARCRPALHDAVRDALAAVGRADTPIEDDEAVATGAILENTARTVHIDATLIARLRRLRPALGIEAVRAIEGTAP